MGQVMTDARAVRTAKPKSAKRVSQVLFAAIATLFLCVSSNAFSGTVFSAYADGGYYSQSF